MFQECVSGELEACLDLLVRKGIVEDGQFYLAGGTGLALQLGHRRSDDLDLFTPVGFNAELVKKRLAEAETIHIMGEATGTLHVSIGEQKISLLHYPFKHLKPFRFYRGCPVADYTDIAAMKLIAISQRGAKKDFVDLHAVINKAGLPLKEVVKSLEEKYPVRYNLCHIIKSIGYFDDAEGDAMPVVRGKDGFRELTQEEWQDIKNDLLQEQKAMLDELIFPKERQE